MERKEEMETELQVVTHSQLYLNLNKYFSNIHVHRRTWVPRQWPILTEGLGRTQDYEFLRNSWVLLLQGLTPSRS